MPSAVGKGLDLGVSVLSPVCLTALITYTCIGILGASVVLFMYVPDSGFDWPVVIGAGVSIALGELATWYSEHERRKNLESS